MRVGRSPLAGGGLKGPASAKTCGPFVVPFLVATNLDPLVTTKQATCEGLL